MCMGLSREPSGAVEREAGGRGGGRTEEKGKGEGRERVGREEVEEGGGKGERREESEKGGSKERRREGREERGKEEGREREGRDEAKCKFMHTLYMHVHEFVHVLYLLLVVWRNCLS